MKHMVGAKRLLGKTLRNPIQSLAVGLVRFYQVVVSPAIPSRCKYYPSCSQYAVDALREYGVLRGLVLASWRVLRCNPLSYGGYDPVAQQRLFRSRRTPLVADGPRSGVGQPLPALGPRAGVAGDMSDGHQACNCHPVRG